LSEVNAKKLNPFPHPLYSLLQTTVLKVISAFVESRSWYCM